MAARYGFGGKDDMKGQPAITAGRFGGGFKGKGRNNLRDTLDKFGKVKDFLNHDDTEMVVPTNLSRPGPNKATRPSWPKHTNFGQMMMKKKEDDDDEKGNQESFTPADKAEDSSKKPNNNFWQDLGSNPSPNNDVIKPTNYRGTAMDPPKDDKQSYGVINTSSNKVKESRANCYTINQDSPYSVDLGPKQPSSLYPVDLGLKKSDPLDLGLKQHSDYVFDDIGQIKKQLYGVNDTSSNKDNSNKVKDSSSNCYTIDQSPPYHVDLGTKQPPGPSYSVNPDSKQHSDYVTDGIGQIKKQNMEIAGSNSKTSITQDSPPKHRTNGFPNINWQDKDDEPKKNNIAPTPRTLVSNKPNISNGWQDYYYNRAAQRWIEITPNPPPQLRYGGAYPNLRPVYRRPVIDSKWAEKKYNGVLLADN